MNNIKKLFRTNKPYSLKAHKLVRKMNPKSRNYFETCTLFVAVNNQLNLPKNIIKPQLNNLTPMEAIELLKEEIEELTEELLKGNNNKIRILEEIGDCGAYLVAIIDRILLNE